MVVGAPSALFVVLLALAGLASWRVVASGRGPAGSVETTRSRPPLVARLATVLPPVPSLGTIFALEAGPRRAADRRPGRDRGRGRAGRRDRRCRDGRAITPRTSSRRPTCTARPGTTSSTWRTRDDAGVVLPKLTRGSRPDSGRDAVAAPGPTAATSTSEARTAQPSPARWRTRRTRARSRPCSRGGRRPGPGEVVLGRRLGRRLGVSIGDSVTVRGYAGEVPLVVTGWFVNPGQDDLDLGILVARDTLERFAPSGLRRRRARRSRASIEEEGAGVVARPDARPSRRSERRLPAIAPDFGRVSPPSVVGNLAEVGATPGCWRASSR